MADINDENLPILRFSVAASRERYQDHWNTKFCCEQGFHLLNLQMKVLAFHTRLLEFRWALLTEVPLCYLLYLSDELLRFPSYCSIWWISPYHPHPGSWHPLNATALKKVLELLEVSDGEYEVNMKEMNLDWLRDIVIKPARRDQVYWATIEGKISTNLSPYAKRWLHLVTRRILQSSNHIEVTFPRALVLVCVIHSIELNMGAEILLEWKMFYRGNEKVFFLLGLVTAMYKWAGVPLIDTN